MDIVYLDLYMIVADVDFIFMFNYSENIIVGCRETDGSMVVVRVRGLRGRVVEVPGQRSIETAQQRVDRTANNVLECLIEVYRLD